MEIDSNDSDAEEMKRLINYDDDDESAEESNEEMSSNSEEGEEESEPSDDESDQEEISNNSSEEEENKDTKLKKRTLKERLHEEQEIRDKEKRMQTGKDAPKDIDDFERLLVANMD